MAHCLTWDDTSIAPHGPEFAATYLTLVRQQMGKAAYDALRAALREHRYGKIGPLVKPDPSRTVTPRAQIEQRERAAARARSAREKAEQQQRREQTHRRLVGYTSRAEAQAVLRALIKDGHFGPTGSASRKAALATARALV